MAKLKWRDSEDVYKPISRSLKEFLQEKQDRIIQQNPIGIEDLHRKLRNNRMSVFVEREAEDQLIQHLSIDPHNETGGVLVGQAYLCTYTKKHYTEIVGSIAAPYTVGNRVHFQFTSECWQAILSNQKQYFPTTTIVGWYHSHPGHGIFLSGTDLNTQRLCFKQIWQIAVVYDPLRLEIGYFYDADGRKIDAIYLQELSQFAQSQPKQHQLNWRQPGAQLPALPTSPSVPLDNIPNSNDDPLQDGNPPITGQAQTTGKNQDKIIMWVTIILGSIIIVFLVLSLYIFTSRSQPYPQKPQPAESKPTHSQPVESQPEQ